MDTEKKPEPWVSTKDISKHLGVSVDTVRNWIKREIIPCHKIGKLWKFKISEVDAWVINGQAGDEKGEKYAE